MNKRIFKNTKIKKRTRLAIAIALSFFLVFLTFSKISYYISFNMNTYIRAKVKKENMLILKNSFIENREKNTINSDLIKVTLNGKEEIISVDFDIPACTKILGNITDSMNGYLGAYNYKGYRTDIPLGFLSKNPLLMNLGPKIPIKVEIADIALGNITTQIREYGINNALVEVFAEIYVKTSILYPLETFEESTTYKTLLSSKIIAGTVPSFYNGLINSSSGTISLPLE